ncbi:MAG: hypothetical protein KL863_29130 [Rhizobium sp.]|nr:hypothetical protein [Rhizobium sp.]
MRFLLRFFSLLFLVGAVMTGIIDAIQSVASATAVIMPFGAAIFSVNPDILAAAETYAITHLPPFVWNGIAEWLLLQPAFAVFLCLSLLFWVMAFKREPMAGRFAA